MWQQIMRTTPTGLKWLSRYSGEIPFLTVKTSTSMLYCNSAYGRIFAMCNLLSILLVVGTPTVLLLAYVDIFVLF